MSVFMAKSQFKPKALEYFRQVESTREELILTDRGRPVIKIVPYDQAEPHQALKDFRGSVVSYQDPLEPVGLEDWEALN